MRINVHCVRMYVMLQYSVLRTVTEYLLLLFVCMTKSVVEEAKLNNLK